MDSTPLLSIPGAWTPTSKDFRCFYKVPTRLWKVNETRSCANINPQRDAAFDEKLGPGREKSAGIWIQYTQNSVFVSIGENI